MNRKFGSLVFFMIINVFLFFFLMVSVAGAEGIEEKIKVLRSGVSERVVAGISRGLESCEVDSDLVLAIIKVESDFKLNAVNKRSSDFGLMQINNWHVKRSGLDRNRLLIDAEYNVIKGCGILKWFVDTYPLVEAIGRYNCGTASGCVDWKSVVRYKRMVLKYLKRVKDV